MSQQPSLAKREPVRLADAITGVLQIAVALGAIGLTTANVNALGAGLDLTITALTPIVMAVIQWVSAEWKRQRVSSPATAETLANTIKDIETSRGKGAPVKVPLSALRAAERVLDEPEHPVRWIGNAEP